MLYKTLKVLTNAAETERALIEERQDGIVTFRMQWMERHGWGQLGPECGLYDSLETAENEARGRIAWLTPLAEA